MTFYKISAGRVNTSSVEEFVGEAGTIFYDGKYGSLRLSDGKTVGGITPTQVAGKHRSATL